MTQATNDSPFACDVTLHNAKFSTTIQKIRNSRSSIKSIDAMFDMLNSQSFTLNNDLVQTAFTCNDSLFIQRLIGYTVTNVTISKCETSQNDSILSVAVSLPTHEISIQLTLVGLKTIGAIRLGLSGSSAVSIDNR
jgi:hypothetical protein